MSPLLYKVSVHLILTGMLNKIMSLLIVFCQNLIMKEIRGKRNSPLIHQLRIKGLLHFTRNERYQLR